MRNRYILKFFLNILITCAIIAGLSGLASGQSKFENRPVPSGTLLKAEN